MLFTLLADRYERGSVLLTSNLPFSKWEAIFKDPMTTAAAIDRLVHHSVILELNLASYRLEQAKTEEGRRMKRKVTFLDWRLRLQTSGIYRLPCHPRRRSRGRAKPAPDLVWPRSQRSGCIPAEPYPLLRPAPV